MNLNELSKIAYANQGFGHAKLAAAIMRRHKLISIGINSGKTHPLQKKFSKNNRCIHLHAEIDAIRNALRMGHNIEGTTMLIARTKKNGQIGLAKPCQACQRAIIHFGIRDVIWTE